MASSTTSPAAAPLQRRTWAQIVKGATVVQQPATQADKPELEPEEDLELVPEPRVELLRPAPQGARLCRCRGEVLVMLRHYGWIAPLDKIDHPDSWRNGGRIYVAAEHVEGGVELGPGDCVTFYLYADSRGLGAEACCLASPGTAALWPEVALPAPPLGGPRQQPSRPCGLSPDAEEFVPHGLSMEAEEFVPHGLSPGAEEFVPGAGPSVMNPSAPEFVPPAAAMATPTPVPQRVILPQVAEINTAYFTDSDTDGAEGGDEACSSHDGESDLATSWEQGSDDLEAESIMEAWPFSQKAGEDAQDEVEVDDELEVVVMRVCLKGSLSADGSTSAGEDESDFEDEILGVNAPPCPVRLPPGLHVLAAP